MRYLLLLRFYFWISFATDNGLQQSLSILILPFVNRILVSHFVAQTNAFLQTPILSHLNTNLQIHHRLHQFELLVKALELGVIRISEVISLEIQSRSSRHDIGDNLHQLLLI